MSSARSGNDGQKKNQMQRHRMQPTSTVMLLVIAGVAALFGLVITLGFYGSFPPIRIVNSVVLWLLAIVCLIAALIIRKKISDGEIGLDRSQMNPLTVANWMITGKSAAWVGAIFGGFYVGMGIYVLNQMSTLTAAQDDVPGVAGFVLGGIASAVAGAFLERSCIAPPNDLDYDATYGGNTVGA